MAASEMRFSCFSPPCTRRRCPPTQESHPSALDGLGVHYDRFKLHSPLGATPWAATATTGGPSTTTTRAPTVLGVTGWVIAARRASPHVGTRTSGRWPATYTVHSAGYTPCDPTAMTGGTSTPTTRAPGVLGVTG